MPHYHREDSPNAPTSLAAAKLLVEQHLETSCLAINQNGAHYTFKEFFCENKTCLDRSKNVFDSIKKTILTYNIQTKGWKFIFHYKGDACNINAKNFNLLANSRNINNENIILWPLLMKNEYRFSLMRYNSILHDEINKYLHGQDKKLWQDKKSTFIFRGRNSGNPFSCTQYPWDRSRASRCNLLLEHLKLPNILKNSADVGFNELYPKFKNIKRNIDNLEFLNDKFSKFLIPGKNITDLQAEIKLVSNYIKPAISKNKILEHKYILCPEGFDCSSSLCWVLASNSLAVVPPFHYENIIINSRYLKPYIHFLPIKEDYSNLNEVINWALNNDQACKEMVEHANTYMKHFIDEDSMLFVQKTIIQRLLN